MTKQELLNGKLFSLNRETTKYKLETTNGKYYTVTALHYSNKGTLLFSDYEANIDKIGSKYFTYYNFVLGKQVTGKINFSEL